MTEQSSLLKAMPDVHRICPTFSDPPTKVPSYVYHGCYTDVPADRAMTRLSPKLSQETWCAQAAAALGYRFFALQYQGECFASNSFASATRHGLSSNCNTPCTVNSTQMCGGAGANGLYEIGV